MPKKEMYHLAAEFRNTKLWERLYDSELFAVRLAGGEIGYVTVMGMLGEHLALAVYPGAAGLDTYRLLGQAHRAQSELERNEHRMSQDCIMCSFENKPLLRQRDLAEIQAYGLTFRGKNAYPMFQRMRPRFMPWYLEDGRDEEWLRQGLLAGLEVARRLKGAPVQQDLFHAPEPGASKEELGFSEGAPFDREIPLLSPREDGTFEWGSIPLPEPVVPVFPSPRLADDITAMRLKKQKTPNVWECEIVMLPEPTADGEADADGFVREPQSAPYFPYMLLMVNHADGMVLHFGVASDPDGYAMDLIGAFMEAMMKNGVPGEVLARGERTRALLSGVAEQVGIRVTAENNLPFLDEAEESLAESQGRDNVADMEAALDKLMDNATVHDLPEEMRRQLLELSRKDGLLSAAAIGKINRFLSGGEAAPSAKAAARPRKEGEKRSRESYVVSVSLGTGCYRHIRLSATCTLFDLHKAILDAFGFEDDHAHAFFMDNSKWGHRNSYYSRGIDDAGRFTDSYTLFGAGLSPGKQFKYVFDFGDEWTFQCKTLKLLPETTDAPRIVRSVGEAPPQYPGMDEEEEEESIYPEIYPKKKLARMYRALKLPEETVQLLHRYFDAFANLYGILPLSKALEIYNRQNPPIDEIDFIRFAEITRHETHNYAILGEDDLYSDVVEPTKPLNREIVEESITIGDDDYDEMKEGQEGKPYYIPGKQVLLRYADYDYFEENAEYLALRDFFRDRMKLSQEDADDIADDLRLDIYMGEGDIRGGLEELKRMGVTFARSEDVNAFRTLYIQLANNTRTPVNRGHTVNELQKKRASSRTARSSSGTGEAAGSGAMPKDTVKSGAPAAVTDAPGEKISRNRLCPCGSGKKYKHCCGKDS